MNKWGLSRVCKVGSTLESQSIQFTIINRLKAKNQYRKRFDDKNSQQTKNRRKLSQPDKGHLQKFTVDIKLKGKILMDFC